MGLNKKIVKSTITHKRGMESVGDFEHEWLTTEESKQKWKEQKECTEQCKKDGTYGQEYSFTISAEYDSVLDKPSEKGELNASTYSFLMWNPSDYEKPKVEIKKYEIWIGFVPSWGQGDHDSTAPRKLAEVEAKSFEIACCIYEHESALEILKNPNYSRDSWFGHWGYNPKDNSTFHLGKFFETEEDAWETFKNKKSKSDI